MITLCPTEYDLPVWIVIVFEPVPTSVLVVLVALVPGAPRALAADADAALACVVAVVALESAAVARPSA
jgi:uncharacterized membrane protein